MATKKPDAKVDTRKAITYRVDKERWKELQTARIAEDISAQDLIDQAVDMWLADKKKNKIKRGTQP